MTKHTVLCVDDEKNILSSLRRTLRKEPYKLLLADTGTQALELLEQHPVDVILSDQRMPEMKGTELLRRVKEKYPRIIRMVLSGYAEVSSIMDAINQGKIYKFISKPWNDDELRLTVRRAIEQYDLIARNQELNDELATLNKNLEQTVDERTYILRLSQQILNDLPVAVLGVTREGEVVLINDCFAASFDNSLGCVMGKDIHDCFPEELCRTIQESMDNNRSIERGGLAVGGKEIAVSCGPFAGKDDVQGVTVAFIEQPAQGG